MWQVNGVPQNVRSPGPSELSRMRNNDSSGCGGVVKVRISRRDGLGQGWTINPMTSVLKTDRERRREGADVQTEAGTEVIESRNAKMAGSHRELGEKHGTDTPLEPPILASPGTLGFWTSGLPNRGRMVPHVEACDKLSLVSCGRDWAVIAVAELNYNGDVATGARRHNQVPLLSLMNKMVGRFTCSILTITVWCHSV